MPINNAGRFWGLPLVLVIASCAAPSRDIPYQPVVQAQVGKTEAVESLHLSAAEKLKNQDYQQATEYLQRAIRIDPRNALSWHYLALTYWQREDFSRCLEMLARSFTYNLTDSRLDQANQELKARCQAS